MNNFFSKILEFYNTNKKLQAISVFLLIFVFMYIVYISFASNSKQSEHFEIKPKSSLSNNNKEKNNPKIEENNSLGVKEVTSIEKKQKTEQEKESDENIKTINTIIKNRFDSDIKKKFKFNNNF